ncbi:unnamed protein product [Effrenium voratum]|uniref:Uncharacterized protein n=1 Tax=Effrenium voratum TaxID=2562239 RepID=A0AA36NBS4_9DINO|nr:unnamed protein product [Effrenium voratum]
MRRWLLPAVVAGGASAVSYLRQQSHAEDSSSIASLVELVQADLGKAAVQTRDGFRVGESLGPDPVLSQSWGAPAPAFAPVPGLAGSPIAFPAAAPVAAPGPVPAPAFAPAPAPAPFAPAPFAAPTPFAAFAPGPAPAPAPAPVAAIAAAPFAVPPASPESAPMPAPAPAPMPMPAIVMPGKASASLDASSAPDDGDATFTETVKGVDHDLLVGQPQLKDSFQGAVQRVLAAEVGHGLQAKEIAVVLRPAPGAVVVQASLA